MEKLRGHTTGYAIPTLVIDAPGGGGKIPLSPNYVVSYKKGAMTLRNFQNKEFTYHEPSNKKDQALTSTPENNSEKVLI